MEERTIGSVVHAFIFRHFACVLRRRVAEVDTTLKVEMEREIARMRQREKTSKSKQIQQFRNFFDRHLDIPIV